MGKIWIGFSSGQTYPKLTTFRAVRLGCCAAGLSFSLFCGLIDTPSTFTFTWHVTPLAFSMCGVNVAVLLPT